MKNSEHDLKCPRCGKTENYVHIDRGQNIHQIAFGCLTCGTAVEKEGKYYANETR